MTEDLCRIRGNEFTVFCPVCGRLAHVTQFYINHPEMPLSAECRACGSNFLVESMEIADS